MAEADRKWELVVVMPVYQEEASIARVVREWVPELSRSGARFVLLAIDDGSRDGTPGILDDLAAEYGSRVAVVHQRNRGHGQSCLEGYRWAIERGAQYVLQIDSDGQCDPRDFAAFWALRNKPAVVYGVRKRREDGRGRLLISGMLRWMLRLRFGVDCPDANVPYRLMRLSDVRPAIERIPPSFDLANVAFAVLLARDASIETAFVPITFRKRYGGMTSVRAMRFAGKGLRLQRQLRELLR